MFVEQPAPLQAVIAATDPAVIIEHDICFRPSWEFPKGPHFGSGPVTLAGDAAHAIRATGEWGAAAACLYIACKAGRRWPAIQPSTLSTRHQRGRLSVAWFVVLSVLSPRLLSSHADVLDWIWPQV